MTTTQKVIKYIAMAFSIFLIVSIISGVLKLLGLLLFVTEVDGTTEEITGYTVSENIDELEIEIAAAEFTISTGDELTVESNLKDLTVKEDNGVLKITERRHATINYNRKALLNVIIPENITFDEVSIVTGAGKVSVDTLSAEELHLKLGAGTVNIKELNAYSEAQIEGGAGNVTIESGTLCDLDMELGVGEANITASLEGDSEINQGVGSANLILTGDRDEYSVHVEKGIGNIKIDGENASNDSVYGHGDNEVEVKGGIGEINISFE